MIFDIAFYYFAFIGFMFSIYFLGTAFTILWNEKSHSVLARSTLSAVIVLFWPLVFPVLAIKTLHKELK